MGSRIPEFVTRELASSVTGTTGIDTSRSTMFGAISSGAASAFNAATAFAAEKQRVTQFAEADKLQKEYEIKAEKVIRIIQKDFAQNPADSIEALDKLGSEALQDSIKDIKSPRLQAMMSQRISSVNQTLRKGMKKWVSDQAVSNAGTDFSAFINITSGEVARNPTIENLEIALTENLSRMALANSIFSPSQAAKIISDGNISIMSGFLNGMMRDAPAEGLRLLREGIANTFFDQDLFEEFEGKLEASVIGFNEQVKVDKMVNTINKHNTAETLMRAQKFTPAAVTKLEQEEEEENGSLTFERKESYKDLMKIATENVDKTAIESQDVRIKLNDELRSLNVSTDKRTAEAQLRTISDFMQNVNREYAAGKIGAKFKEKLLNNVTTPFKEKLQTKVGEEVDTLTGSVLGFTAPLVGLLTFGYFGKPASPYDAGYLKTQDWLDERGFSEGVSMSAKDNILNGMLDRIDDAKQAGEILTDTLVESFVEIEIQSEIFRQNPQLRNIPPKGIIIILDNGKGVSYRIMPDYSFTLINQ